MFNKVLVVVEKDVDIQDNRALLKAFAENFDADYSIHFSKGPMDVLDHSSQKFAFGSKLGVDLTKAFPEEVVSESKNKEVSEFNADVLLEIREIVNVSNLTNDFGLPVILANVKKDKNFSKQKLEAELQRMNGIDGIKAIFIFNEGADLNDKFTLIWLLGGNLEPDRDVSMLNANKENKTVLIDATFKTEEHDNFKRDWPNVVTMDDKTISVIDKKWDELGLGKFIESPSLKFKALVNGKGAVRI
jgi:4-hydroxy-3-polyprenylbenzoate decarboxylase